MTFEQEQQFVSKIKKYVTDNLSLSQISDDDLQQRIEEIVEQYIGEQYCSIDQRVSIVEQVYSSIRGFGLLDSIIKDESITEVMINGPKMYLSNRTVVFTSLINNLKVSENLKMLFRELSVLPAERLIRQIRFVIQDFRTALVLMWCYPDCVMWPDCYNS